MDQHRHRLEELPRAYATGSQARPHRWYALIGQPETLVILERMETNLGLRSQRKNELDVFLDHIKFAWGARIRLGR